jgi:tRNA (guanosine-2'-O-)-methyltransferase
VDAEAQSVEELGLPSGPPLHLERPGRPTTVLGAFLLPERIERFRTTLARRTRHLTVLADRFHDAHNIAACVRSCEAFGIQDLHLIPQDAVKKKKKMSMMVTTGSHKWLTTIRHPDAESAVLDLKRRGYRLVVADPPSAGPSTPIDELGLAQPVALVLGNERDGVSPALREAADELLHIPMAGFVESLNVSVACAVALSRLRSRLENELGPEVFLSEEERLTLLDLWVTRDVPRVAHVVAELIRRSEDPESG